jgi:RNA recognition motif-containing protein
VDSFNGYELEGRAMQVKIDGKGGGGAERKPREQTGTIDPNRLFIGNLAWTVTSEVLYPLFASMGAQSVIVQMKPNGTSKGFALAQMNSPEAAGQAIQSFNGYELEGRNMSVKFDNKGY